MIDFRALLTRKPPSPDAFGFAVVGLGRIADHFLRAVANSPTVSVTALVSSDAKKAKKIARRYAVPHTCGYGDFDWLRDRPDVHAVYLALPVSMHREFTAHSAMAGKHVLVEKPMAANAEDCCAMIANCRAAGVLLSVAYRGPYDPLHQQLRALIRDGALGRIERIDGQFGFKLDESDWRSNGALAGGGSLYDVGIYPLNAARFLLGEEPVRHTAKATKSNARLETSIDWTSFFPSGAEAHCRSSYLERQTDTLAVHGTAGSLTLDPAFSHTSRFRLRGHYTHPHTGERVEVDTATPDTTPSHFRLEAEHLAHCARTGAPLLTPGADGLHDLEAIAAIYQAAGVTSCNA